MFWFLDRSTRVLRLLEAPPFPYPPQQAGFKASTLLFRVNYIPFLRVLFAKTPSEIHAEA